MKLGSVEHKELFCRSFLDSHLKYEPETLPWPDLDPVSLEKLRSIPFWRQALLTEEGAGVMVDAFSQTIDDPLLKEAIALQAKEEARHGRLMAYLIKHYGIEIKEPEPPVIPKYPQKEFTDFGFEECLDSFFAFGMFGIAHQVQYLPESIFEIFDPILDEEARHIVFFVNWVTYLQIQSGRGFAPLRGLNSFYHYSKAIWKLVAVFGDTEQEEKAFTATGANNFMDNLTAELFFHTCIEENAKRMNKFEPELLRPQLLPILCQMAYGCLKLLPKKSTTTTLQQQS
jgi:hypothetical protein